MFRDALRRLLRAGRGAAAYDVDALIDERLARQILADVLPRALRGLLLKPWLGSCRGRRDPGPVAPGRPPGLPTNLTQQLPPREQVAGVVGFEVPQPASGLVQHFSAELGDDALAVPLG